MTTVDTDDAAGFTSCCGLVSCSAPLRTQPLGNARGLCYRGPWRLPGPDLHRLAALSLSLGYVMSTSLSAMAPELLDALHELSTESVRVRPFSRTVYIRSLPLTELRENSPRTLLERLKQSLATQVTHCKCLLHFLRRSLTGDDTLQHHCGSICDG
jgi:hypothetical protein